MRQDGANYAVLAEPTDEVDFPNAAGERGEQWRGRSLGELCGAAGIGPQRHEHEDDGSFRALHARAIDVEEVPESVFVVGVTGRTALKA